MSLLLQHKNTSICLSPFLMPAPPLPPASPVLTVVTLFSRQGLGWGLCHHTCSSPLLTNTGRHVITGRVTRVPSTRVTRAWTAPHGFTRARVLNLDMYYTAWVYYGAQNPVRHRMCLLRRVYSCTDQIVFIRACVTLYSLVQMWSCQKSCINRPCVARQGYTILYYTILYYWLPLKSLQCCLNN